MYKDKKPLCHQKITENSHARIEPELSGLLSIGTFDGKIYGHIRNVNRIG